MRRGAWEHETGERPGVCSEVSAGLLGPGVLVTSAHPLQGAQMQAGPWAESVLRAWPRVWLPWEPQLIRVCSAPPAAQSGEWRDGEGDGGSCRTDGGITGAPPTPALPRSPLCPFLLVLIAVSFWGYLGPISLDGHLLCAGDQAVPLRSSRVRMRFVCPSP